MDPSGAKNREKTTTVNNISLNIRAATPDDLESIGELYSDLYKLHHVGAPEVFKSLDQEAITKELVSSNPSAENIIVATCDNSVIGYLSYSEKTIEETAVLHFRKMLCVNDLIVSIDYRNSGVGTLLLDKLERYAKSQYFDSIEIPVFSFSNSAIGFYQKYGYGEYVRRLRKGIINSSG